MSTFEGLSAPQLRMVTDLSSPEVMLIGGVGSGKTMALAWAGVVRALVNPPGTDGLIISPTYNMLTAPMLETLFEVLEMVGVPYEQNKSDRVIVLPGDRKIWLRSADKPERIKGINVAWVLFDEGASTSAESYKKAQERMRQSHTEPMVRQLLVATTPEGRRTWVYAREQSGDAGLNIIRATPYDNPGAPADWLQRLEQTYANDPAGRDQYIRGIATDMTGNIYTNLLEKHFQPCVEPRAGQLVVGWDFNVGLMATVLCSWDEDARRLHVFDEVVSKRPAQTDRHADLVIDVLMKRCGVQEVDVNGKRQLRDGRGRPVLAFIDASSRALSTNAAWTDQQLVREAGFLIRSGDSNPLVRERVASVQYALAHDMILVDSRAKQFARAFREHDYDKHGDPRKDDSAEFQPDHYMDAFGYVVHGLIPIGSRHHRAPTTQRMNPQAILQGMLLRRSA